MRGALAVRGVSKVFRSPEGRELVALQGVDVDVADREFVCLIGPSGCGKSTLLRIIANLETLSAGTIEIDGRPHDEAVHRIGFVFQQDALLPWRSIANNVGVGLEARGVARAERRDRSRRIIKAVGLVGFEDYYPHEASGGMRQRAAVARALVTEPDILLMDEPFASVDVLMKARLHAELARVLGQYKSTVVFVTHDIEEATFLADRVIVMSPRPGRVASIVPLELARPRDRLSADFVLVRRRVHEALRAAEAATMETEVTSCRTRPG